MRDSRYGNSEGHCLSDLFLKKGRIVQIVIKLLLYNFNINAFVI